MLAPFLIAALLTAAASESEEEDKLRRRTETLRRKLLPSARHIPMGVTSIHSFKHVSDFVEQGLMHLGFPRSYAESVSVDVSDDWMNMDPSLEDTMRTPWFIRFDRLPVLPREPHETPPMPEDVATAQVMRRQIYALISQIPSFEDEYFDQLADALVEGWVHQDPEPRWDTHSKLGLNAKALYYKLRSLGWPHDQAESMSWAGGDEADQERLIASPIPPYASLKKMADELEQTMVSMGFPEAYAQGASSSLIYYRMGHGITRAISKSTRGTWSMKEPDPQRAALEIRTRTFLTRALQKILGLHPGDARTEATKMSKDWVYESMDRY